MTPADIKQARAQLGLTQIQLGRMLGLDWSDAATRIYISRAENGHPTRQLNPAQALLLRAYISGYRPDDWPREAPQ